MRGFFAVSIATLVVIALGVSLVASSATQEKRTPVVGLHTGKGRLIEITEADGGRTTVVPIRATVEVVLPDSTLTWSALRVVGPQILDPNGPPVTGSKELTRSYTAVALGGTTLEAVAAPKCVTGEACPQFLLLWRARIVVRA